MTFSELYISFYYYDLDNPYLVALIKCKHEDFEPGSLVSVLFAKLNSDLIPDSIFAVGINENPRGRGYGAQEIKDLDTRISGCNFYKEIENNPNFGLKLGNELVRLIKEHNVLEQGRGYEEMLSNKAMGWIEMEMSRDKRNFYNDSFMKIDNNNFK